MFMTDVGEFAPTSLDTNTIIVQGKTKSHSLTGP